MRILVFGADGGGTKTSGLISDLQGTILADGVVGSTNANVVGIDVAATNLFELIRNCCFKASCEPPDLNVIILGLAGAGSEENRRRLFAKLGKLFGRDLPVRIETDARIALEGAFDGGPGIVVIAGTGSIVIGRKRSGGIVTLGGWGRAFGDEGSGYFLGVQALKAQARNLDGRGGSTIMAGLLEKQFGFNSRERLIAAVYRENFEPSKAAPVVLAAAEQGDDLALSVLRAGAAELASQVHAVTERLDLDGPVGLAMLGGLIDHKSIYSEILTSEIEKAAPSARVQPPAHDAVHGAVHMALDAVKKNIEMKTTQ